MKIKLYKLFALFFLFSAIILFPNVLALIATQDGRIDLAYVSYILYSLSMASFIFFLIFLRFKWENKKIKPYLIKFCQIGLGTLILSSVAYIIDSHFCHSVRLDKYIHQGIFPQTITLDDPKLWDKVTWYSPNEEFLKSIEENVRHNKPIPWNLRRPWERSYILSSQYFLLDYLKKHENTKDKKYLEIAKKLIYDWIKKTRSINHLDIITFALLDRYILKPEFIWYDDCAANRIEYQTVTFKKLQENKLIDEKEYKLFLENVIRHGNFLSDKVFYNAKSNHGLMQNRALLYIALAFPEIRMSNEWIKLAVQRMERQAKENVSDDGVHKEFSSFYQYYALKEMLWFYLTCKYNGIDLVPIYELRLRLMMNHIRNLLLPDGSFPLLGDTPEFYADLNDWPLDGISDWKELRRLLDYVRDPRRKVELFKTYKDAGLVLYKAYDSNNKSFLLFNASPERHGHFHYDALSFIYYENGRIFTGSGYPPSRHESRKREISAKYLNTISVDDRNYRLGGSKLLFSQFDPDNKVIVASGLHSLYKGVKIKRNIIYMADQFLFIVDEVSGERVHKYSQNFRVDDSLGFDLRPGDKEIVISGGKRASYNVIIVKPYINDGDRMILPQIELSIPKNLSLTHRGKSFSFLTLIDLSSYNRTKITGDHRHISIDRDGFRVHVSLPIVDEHSVSLSGRS